jgi:hypothetical protein
VGQPAHDELAPCLKPGVGHPNLWRKAENSVVSSEENGKRIGAQCQLVRGDVLSDLLVTIAAKCELRVDFLWWHLSAQGGLGIIALLIIVLLVARRRPR